MCQVAAVRAEVAFPSVMLTAAVPAQAEWNGNDIMFIQERCSQTQISVSKMPGRSSMENMPETSHWISSPGAHPALHSPHPYLASHRHRTPCPADPHHPTQTHLHTYHTSRHKNTHHARFPSHITQTHINTCHSGSTHICTMCSRIHTHPEAYTNAHGHSQSRCRQPLLTHTFR